MMKSISCPQSYQSFLFMTFRFSFTQGSQQVEGQISTASFLLLLSSSTAGLSLISPQGKKNDNFIGDVEGENGDGQSILSFLFRGGHAHKMPQFSYQRESCPGTSQNSVSKSNYGIQGCEAHGPTNINHILQYQLNSISKMLILCLDSICLILIKFPI